MRARVGRERLDALQALAEGPSADGPSPPFTRIPAPVLQALAHLPRALACWAAIESFTGRHGGSADVPQAQIYRQLGWCPSTWWRARRLLLLLGMLEVGMPADGQPVHGPGARRRLVLVHFLARRDRRELTRSRNKPRAARPRVPVETKASASVDVAADTSERGPPGPPPPEAIAASATLATVMARKASQP